MAECESDVQRCDTPNSLEEIIAKEMTDGIIGLETIGNSPTFDFAERSWKTDFTLVVEGTRFYVAKNILALASPVFDRMFESNFKESTTDELELPGKKADHVNEFLRAIYPNTGTFMSKESALKVLPLAEEYQVIKLKQRCEEALLGSIYALATIEDLYRLIKEAHLYNLEALLKTCVNSVSEKSFEDIERANREIVLPADPLRDILQKLSGRLAGRVKELELSQLQLGVQLETYKTWKNYFSKATGKSVILALDRDLVWAGQIWTFTVDVKNRKPVEGSFSIWNNELGMKFDFHDQWVWTQGYKTSIYSIQSSLKNKDKNQIDCYFEIQVAIVNKMPTEDHLVIKLRANFRLHRQTTYWDLVKLSDIEDQKKGFVDDKGNIQLEVNIFMSEPKSLGSENR